MSSPPLSKTDTAFGHSSGRFLAYRARVAQGPVPESARGSLRGSFVLTDLVIVSRPAAVCGE